MKEDIVSDQNPQLVNGHHEATFQDQKNSQESIYQTKFNKPSQSAPKLNIEGNSEEIQHKLALNGKIVFTKSSDLNHNKRT
jgi:hypothetical protein